MTAAVDAEACATAADIICSLRAADVAGWTPPWRDYPSDPSARGDGGAREQLAWPPVARPKRSPSVSAGSGSAVAKKKKKVRPSSRGSPASPLDYSAAGSGASTSGGEDGAFCSPTPPVVSSTGGGVLRVVYTSKVAPVAGRRSILPVPLPRSAAGQRPRKKMRLHEVQQMVRSLSVENDALRQEMKTLLKACTALSKENGKLETRLDQSSNRDGILISEEKKGKPPQPGQRGTKHEVQHGFALPDLNLPALDVDKYTDGLLHVSCSVLGGI